MANESSEYELWLAPTVSTAGQTSGKRFLQQLLESSIVLPEDLELQPKDFLACLAGLSESGEQLRLLVQHGLLTEYQSSRIQAGKIFGLSLGNYRVIDRIASGGMGIIYKAEHTRLRRQVAIKVLPVPRNQQTRMLARFYAEVRAIARLQHPNIVTAIDAGQLTSNDPDAPVLHYLVMEYIPGEDLETFVNTHGPLAPAQACDFIGQVASALVEADKHHLIHRDIKPSNIMITPEGQAKLLDFGLVHHFRSRLTEPLTTMGTVDYMPPEQARDAGTVDIRADIYSLGGTLFWSLTGALPFAPLGNVTRELIQRQTQPPPSVRGLRPDIPNELDLVVKRMMAINPDDRPSTPSAVLSAMLPFRQHASREHVALHEVPGSWIESKVATQNAPEGGRVLIVDDEPPVRDLCRFALEAEGFCCEMAESGAVALSAIYASPFDLILLDIDMPELTGREVLEQVRANPPNPHLKIMMFSGRASADEMAQMMLAGADDYLTKPFSLVQLLARVKSAIRLKIAQDRSDSLQRELKVANAQLERNVSSRDSDFTHARNAVVLAFTKLIEQRSVETCSHLRRMQHYCRVLAEEAVGLPCMDNKIDQSFLQMLEYCAPLHDIGKIALPDDILMKTGKLDPQERLIMQSHTTLGAATLEEIVRHHGPALGFLRMAIEIVRHHHERFDGQGYPDRLAGTAIPLAARIVAVADAYDSLRCRFHSRPPMTHVDAIQVLKETAQGHFDPELFGAFERCSVHFERIYREDPD